MSPFLKAEEKVSDADSAESTPLLDERWSSRDQRLLGAVLLCVYGIVAGTYFWGSLLPAFEADPILSWDASTTTLASTLAAAAETVGLMLAGPLSDFFSPTWLITLNGLGVIVAMGAVSMLSNLPIVVGLIVSLCALKGIMWPAVTAFVSLNISPAKHDLAFILTALGSRTAGTVSSLLLGGIMGSAGCGWREGTQAFMCQIFLFFVIAMYILPSQLIVHYDKERSVSGIWAKTQRLVVSPDAWLAFTAMLGIQCVWVLYGYVSVIVEDDYSIPPSTAASATAVFPLGNFLGLVVGLCGSSYLRPGRARCCHVVQSLSGVVALALLALRTVQLPCCLMLICISGFGMVLPAYLPCLIFSAQSPVSDRAFRLAIIQGLTSLIHTFLTYGFGILREQGSHMTRWLYCVAAIGLLFAVVATALLYLRLENTTEEYVEQSSGTLKISRSRGALGSNGSLTGVLGRNESFGTFHRSESLGGLLAPQVVAPQMRKCHSSGLWTVMDTDF